MTISQKISVDFSRFIMKKTNKKTCYLEQMHQTKNKNEMKSNQILYKKMFIIVINTMSVLWALSARGEFRTQNKMS